MSYRVYSKNALIRLFRKSVVLHIQLENANKVQRIWK
jgi:hypothetical protein